MRIYERALGESEVRKLAGGLVATVTAHDEVGNVTSVTDPGGNATSYDYDELHRLTAGVSISGGWLR